MKIKSHKGPYYVDFIESLNHLNRFHPDTTHLLISPHVAMKYKSELSQILSIKSMIEVSSDEENKRLTKIPNYCRKLLANGLKRNHLIVCVGGGVTMDVASFVSAIVFRGVDWIYYPTTLLSMADSCIGSKNSLQLSRYKNQVGLYNPPVEVNIYPKFLETTTNVDILNGIGEILKVHAIKSPKAFYQCSDWIDGVVHRDPGITKMAIKSALRIKKRLIEKDEFDHGPRLVLNYGHSFGHALETASDFAIPHGIAVNIGCDMANFISSSFMILPVDGWKKRSEIHNQYIPEVYREVLKKIPIRAYMKALRRDKKNRNDYLRLVSPDRKGKIKLCHLRDGLTLRKHIKFYLHGKGVES